MSNPTNETTQVETTRTDETTTETPARPRLTVEVPTQITAGLPKDCVHCFCSKTYCCS